MQINSPLGGGGSISSGGSSGDTDPDRSAPSSGSGYTTYSSGGSNEDDNDSDLAEQSDGYGGSLDSSDDDDSSPDSGADLIDRVTGDDSGDSGGTTPDFETTSDDGGSSDDSSPDTGADLIDRVTGDDSGDSGSTTPDFETTSDDNGGSSSTSSPAPDDPAPDNDSDLAEQSDGYGGTLDPGDETFSGGRDRSREDIQSVIGGNDPEQDQRLREQAAGQDQRLDPSDFTVTDTTVTFQSNETTGASGLVGARLGPGRQAQITGSARRELAAQALSDQIDRNVRPDDVEIDGDTIRLSEDAQDEIQDERIAEAREEYAQEVSDRRGQNYSASDIEVSREDGEFTFSAPRQESYDIDWSFGFGGPEDEVEDAISGAADRYSRGATNLAERAFATDQDNTARSGGEFVLDAFGREELGDQYDEGVRNLGVGIASGAAEIGNIPGLVGTGMEAAEFGAAGVSQTAAGEGGDFGEEAYTRGSAIGGMAYESARENPARTAGMLGGSLIGSVGVFSAARRVGPRTSAATRAVIQPGEEALGYGGYYATRAASSQRTADRLFPNQEPLLFSEEAAIRGTRGAAGRVRSRAQTEGQALRFDVAERTGIDPVEVAERAGGRIRTEGQALRYDVAETTGIDPVDAAQRMRDAPGEAAEGVTRRAREEAQAARFEVAEQTGVDPVETARGIAQAPERAAGVAKQEGQALRFGFAEQTGVDPVEAARSTREAPGRAAGGVARRATEEGQSLRFGFAERTGIDPVSAARTAREVPSRARGRVRQEGISARFQAREAVEDARTRAGVERDRLQQFAQDERGQVQAGRQRRTSQEAEYEAGSVRQIGRGQTEAEVEFEYERPGQARRAETETEQRMAQAQRREVEVGQGDFDSLSFEIGRISARPDVEMEQRGEQRLNQETEQEVEQETEQETEIEQRTRLRQETEQEQRQETEQELETENRFEQESRFEREEDTNGRDTDRKLVTRQPSGGDTDNPLAIGYLSETFAGFAGTEAVSGTRAELEGQGGSFGEYTPEFEDQAAYDESLEFFGLNGDGGGESGWL